MGNMCMCLIGYNICMSSYSDVEASLASLFLFSVCFFV